jgi:hypothetical protein
MVGSIWIALILLLLLGVAHGKCNATSDCTVNLFFPQYANRTDVIVLLPPNCNPPYCGPDHRCYLTCSFSASSGPIGIGSDGQANGTSLDAKLSSASANAPIALIILFLMLLLVS